MKVIIKESKKKKKKQVMCVGVHRIHNMTIKARSKTNELIIIQFSYCATKNYQFTLRRSASVTTEESGGIPSQKLRSR